MSDLGDMDVLIFTKWFFGTPAVSATEGKHRTRQILCPFPVYDRTISAVELCQLLVLDQRKYKKTG